MLQIRRNKKILKRGKMKTYDKCRDYDPIVQQCYNTDRNYCDDCPILKSSQSILIMKEKEAV